MWEERTMAKELHKLLLIALLAVSCANKAAQTPASAPARTVIRCDACEISVELAATAELRRKGYMRREKPGEREGMLFVFRDETLREFWNHDVFFPIDIAFLDARGQVVYLDTMAPMDDRSVGSRRPARYVLEMRAGAFKNCGITLGGFIKIPPSVAEMDVEP